MTSPQFTKSCTLISIDIHKPESKSTELLSDGLFSIYLNGKTVSVEFEDIDKIQDAWIASFLDNLENEPTLTLDELIKNHCIGAIHIQSGTVKSIVLTKHKVELIANSNIKEIVFLQKDRILLIKEKYLLKSFTSNEHYIQYTSTLKFESNSSLIPPTLISEKQTIVGHEFKSRALPARALPDGVIAMYFQGKIVTGKHKNTGESYKALCISPLNNLKSDTSTNLAELIKNKSICALHVENNSIKSVTFTKEKLDLITEKGIKNIAILNGVDLLTSTDTCIMRSFISEDQYIQYVAKLIKS